MTRQIARLLAAIVLAACLCSGCQERFTRQRYETVYPKMPDWKVREVLGEPNTAAGSTWTYIHDCPYYKAEIYFEDSRVRGKSWSNARPSDGPPQ